MAEDILGKECIVIETRYENKIFYPGRRCRVYATVTYSDQVIVYMVRIIGINWRFWNIPYALFKPEQIRSI